VLEKAGAVVKTLFKAGKAGVKKLLSFFSIKKKFKTEDGHSHSLYFEGTEENAELMVASSPKTFSKFISELDKPDAKKAQHKKNAEAEFKLLREAIKKRNTSKKGSEEYQKEQTKKYEVVNGHVNVLSNHMIPLFNMESIGKFELIFGSLENGFGTSMEVKNLHKTTKPPTGSVPGVTNAGYETLKKKQNGGSTYFILGHLLNHNLGGSGKDFRNLAPFTRKGNKDHNVDIEETVKKDLEDGKVINYKVVPVYNGNTVKNQPKNISAKRKKIIEMEEKTPSTIKYEFSSWKKDDPNTKVIKNDHFNNGLDYTHGDYTE
jgi:hypothetical protein